jgi:hypothetical protein
MRRVRHLLFGALLLTVATQCVSYSDGIELDVAYQTPSMVAAIQTDQGYRVRLEQAMITFGEVELVFCDGLTEHALRLFRASKARAHSETTPTELGEPIIIDLMESAGLPLFAGTLKPPPGRYCAVRVTCTPTDADAQGTELQREAMLNTTLLLEGRVEGPEGEMLGPIHIRLTERVEDELRFEAPLVLKTPEQSGSLSVRISTVHWFDGIDFAARDMAAAQAQIMENIQASLEASLGRQGEKS